MRSDELCEEVRVLANLDATKNPRLFEQRCQQLLRAPGAHKRARVKEISGIELTGARQSDAYVALFETWALSSFARRPTRRTNLFGRASNTHRRSAVDEPRRWHQATFGRYYYFFTYRYFSLPCRQSASFAPQLDSAHSAPKLRCRRVEIRVNPLRNPIQSTSTSSDPFTVSVRAG